MNEKNLYYKRGMYIIDKLLNIFSNDSTFYKKRIELIKNELQRCNTNKQLMIKDINSFYITAMVSLIGLNKENIEKMNKHSDYDLYKLDEKEKETMNLDKMKKAYPEFELSRNLITKFDDWLSVEKCDHPTLNYMMNIRNGLLHSEYEPLGEFGDLLSVKNSNYTHFESKILLYGIMSFCLFNFGNNTWTGLTENFNIYEIKTLKKVNTSKELLEKIKTIKVNKLKYEPTIASSELDLPEIKAYNLMLQGKNKDISLEQMLEKIFKDNKDYTREEQNLNEEQLSVIEKMVERYYGNDFYNLDEESQNAQLLGLVRYLVDSRATISEWICEYVDFYNAIMNTVCRLGNNYQTIIDAILNDNTGENNKRSAFACRTSLLLMKLYHILYRLQNSKYEAVDYNNINFDLSANDYEYERTDIDGSKTFDFSIDKEKLKSKNSSLSDKELENKAICDIIRNSLSHGNINIDFKVKNGELIEYVIFEDNYHSKNRKLQLTFNKLEQFLNSEAFETKNCLFKEEEIAKRK